MKWNKIQKPIAGRIFAISGGDINTREIGNPETSSQGLPMRKVKTTKRFKPRLIGSVVRKTWNFATKAEPIPERPRHSGTGPESSYTIRRRNISREGPT